VFLAGCAGEGGVRYHSASPRGDKQVDVWVNYAGSNFWTAIYPRSQTLSWQVFGGQFERVWVGWSENGERISVLSCSQEVGSRVDRFPTGEGGPAAHLEQDRKDIASADENLVASLRKLAAGAPTPPEKVREALFSWYCNGYGQWAIERYWSREKKAFLLPSSSASP
jgi:hypothetical protein